MISDATNRVTQTLALGGSFSGIAVDPEDGLVYAANTQNGTLAILANHPPSNVTFSESGLPQRTAWEVTLDGDIQMTTDPVVTFPALTGIYSYQIGAVQGYRATPSSGELNLSSSPVNVSISFSQTPLITTTIEWAILGVVLVVVLGSVVTFALVRRRGRKPPPRALYSLWPSSLEPPTSRP